MKREITTTELFEAMSAFSEATERQFAEMRNEMATKNELKAFATKDDIKAIRTEMATKEDIKAIRSEMATKEDISGLRNDIRQEIGRVISLFSPIVYNAKDLLDIHPLAQ